MLPWIGYTCAPPLRVGSAMGYAHESLGLLHSSDVLRLVEGLRIEGAVLVDEVTSARHKLRQPAPTLLPSLQSGVTLQKWFDECRLYDVSRLRAVRMLLSLNDIAGLRRHRKLRYTIPIFLKWIDVYRFGMVPVRLAGRYPGTGSGLVVACMMAVTPLAGIATLFWLAGIAFGIFPLVSMALLVVWLSTVFVSTLLHEWAHWRIALRQSAVCFVRRGLRIGVLHAPLSKKLEQRSALLGPFVGMCTVLLVSGVMHVLSAPHDYIGGVLAISVLHVSSWLPFYGDGKTLLNMRKVPYA